MCGAGAAKKGNELQALLTETIAPLADRSYSDFGCVCLPIFSLILSQLAAGIGTASGR
jgi:hypothetical protein